MVGIYKIISPSGYIYIGQSWDIQKRFKEYKRLKCKSQCALFNSFTKHGSNNHIYKVILILKGEINQELLDKFEQFYIDKYKSEGFEMLNIRMAGSRGKHSKETIEKMRLVQSKIPRKKPSEETKLKMSLAHMGRVGAMKGKNHTEESKAKMRESFAKIKVWTGRKHSPESIEKMRLVKLGKKNPRC